MRANSVSGICHKPASLHWTQVAQDVIKIYDTTHLQALRLHHSSLVQYFCDSLPGNGPTTCTTQTHNMADDTSRTGSASMSINAGAEISDNDGQVHELHATSTPTDHTIGQAHYDKREAHYDTNYDVDPEAPGGKTHSLGHDGDHEAGYEGDDDDEDQVQDIRNDQKGSKDSKERPTRIASARLDEGSETAVKHKPSTSQDEDENGNDKASIPASSFEDVANRSARTATTVSNGEASSSESDSEDIFVGPRNSQYESSNANETPRSRFSVMGGDEFHPRSESPSPTSDEAGAENLNSRSDNVSSSEENDDSGEDGSSDEDEGKVHDVSSGRTSAQHPV